MEARMYRGRRDSEGNQLSGPCLHLRFNKPVDVTKNVIDLAFKQMARKAVAYEKRGRKRQGG